MTEEEDKQTAVAELKKIRVVSDSLKLSEQVEDLLHALKPDVLTAYLGVASVMLKLLEKMPPAVRAEVVIKLFKQLRKD